MSDTTNTNNSNVPAIFLDRVGRTIMGIVVEQTSENILRVQNPVVIIVGGDNTGKMSVQLFPLFFREFLGDKNSDVQFDFNKSDTTMSNIDAIDFRLQAQYTQMFSKNNTFVAQGEQLPPTEQPKQEKVVNLFDE
jgi:hypothetical protein